MIDIKLVKLQQQSVTMGDNHCVPLFKRFVSFHNTFCNDKFHQINFIKQFQCYTVQ